MGYDNEIACGWIAGLTLSYADGKVDNNAKTAITSTNDTNEYMGAIYTKYKPYLAYFVGSLGGGIIQNNTKLISPTIHAQGDYNSKILFTNTEIGYDFGESCWTLEPHIGAEYAFIRNESYDEVGAGSRHFDSQDWNVFEVPVGLRIAKDIETDNYMITPQMDIAYARNFGDTGASTTVNFIGNPTDHWSITNGAYKRNSYRGNLNLKINSQKIPFALNLGYAIDYRSDYANQQIYGTIRYDF